MAGGLYSSVYLIGFAFTVMFSYNLLMSSLIRQLYSFNTKFPQEQTKKKKSKKKGGESSEDDATKREEDPTDIYDDEMSHKAKQLKAAELEK